MSVYCSKRPPVMAFGPRLPEFGSWNWVGADLAEALSHHVNVRIFDDVVPSCDVVVFVKSKPPLAILQELCQRTKIVYCPVDLYGSPAAIDEDWRSLRLCQLVIVHCLNLTKYFSSYTRVAYMDHQLKFTSPLPAQQPSEGPILWTGKQVNLPPLVEWVNEHDLPDRLVVLTDLDADRVEPARLGFLESQRISLYKWAPEAHRVWAGRCRLAIDIKGNDFRARHKPPAKAHDYIASGLPLAMNLDSSIAQDLQSQGLSLVNPLDREQWQSLGYWQQTQQFAAKLRGRLTLEQVALEFLDITTSILGKSNTSS